MTPGQTALLSALAKGHAKEIDNSTFRSEWLDGDPEIKAVVAETISMAREGKAFALVNLMARCKSVPRTRWTEIISALKGNEGADWKDAVERIKHEYMLEQVAKARDEMTRQMADNPAGVEVWLPSVTSGLVSTIRSGVTYDSRFSSHINKAIPQVRFKSLIYGMDDMLRGGYRDTFFLLYCAPSKHGKTTTLRSHIADMLLQQKRVSFVNTENLEQIAAALVIVALSGLPREEVETKKFSSDQHRTAYKQWAEYVEEYLKIYNWEWLNTDRLMRIAKWDRADAIVVDYLKNQPGMFNDRRSHEDPVGDMGEYLKNEIASQGMVVLSAGQIASEAGKKLIKSKEPSDIAPVYGSARVHFACDEYIFLRRSLHAPDMAEFRVWLDRYAGKLDTVHNIPLNKETLTLDMEASLDEKASRSQSDPDGVLSSGVPNVPEPDLPEQEEYLQGAVQGSII